MSDDRGQWAPPTEPTDGLPLTDRHGVVWTPRDGVWWGDIGHGYEDYRQWRELLIRGPLEVSR